MVRASELGALLALEQGLQRPLDDRRSTPLNLSIPIDRQQGESEPDGHRPRLFGRRCRPQRGNHSRFGVSRALPSFPNPKSRHKNGHVTLPRCYDGMKSREPSDAARGPSHGKNFGRPARVASALDIILNGPLGAGAFSEFGGCTLAGYFRAFPEPLALLFAQKSKISPGARVIASRKRFSCAVVVTPVRDAPVHSAQRRCSRAKVSTSMRSSIEDQRFTGIVVREQIAGPFQISASDVAVGHASYSFDLRASEAIALSKGTPFVLLSTPAAARRLLPTQHHS
ncbi:hypothetical protein EI94DRAFT_1830300 [Lactarius quietus]|nr:hypothetical protein EI94DRAFT_1830300 [Lactarius quietus]